MAKHRATKARRLSARARTIERVDARTGDAHLLTGDAVATGRRGRGHYIALCGVEILPAPHRPAAGVLQIVLNPHPEIGEVSVSWYQSMDDHDAHRGTLSRGKVDAVCGVRFRPRRWAFGQVGMPSRPGPDLICPKCAKATS